jgi:hypothetical protein
MEKVIQVLSTIWEYRFLILLIAALLLVALNELNIFKGKIKDAMLKAENLAKDAILKSGVEEEQWVVNNLYLFISKRWLFLIKKLLSEEQLREIIRKLYKNAVDYIDDGQLNNSI